MTSEFQNRLGKGGSLKAEGFGDGIYQRNHPQAPLEAATQSLTDIFLIHG